MGMMEGPFGEGHRFAIIKKIIAYKGASNWTRHLSQSKGVSFSLIWTVILRAMRGIVCDGGGWVIGLGIFSSLRIEF